MTRRSFLFSLFISWISVIFIQAQVFAGNPDQNKPPHVKYVFLFIGDGMGQAQVNLTQAYLAALDDRIGFDALTFTGFPQTGFVSTYANNQLITCSAAAGTALATGHKTNINRISMDPEGNLPYESIAEKAKRSGYKVGILSSVSIDHATPAVFYAHQPDRDMHFEIGLELTESDFDFFGGGGFLSPDGLIDEQPANLIEIAKQKGFNVVDTKEGFEKLGPGKGKTLLISPKLSGKAAMPYYLDMDPTDLTLADFTAKAIDLLSGDQGFFMMVESGKIDWACHGNDAATVIQEVIAFDKAVENAYSIYLKYPDETLIIVTSDHETGGLSLGNSMTKYNSYLGLLKYQKSSVDELNNTIKQFRGDKTGDPEADFNRIMKIAETDIGLNSKANNTLLTDEEIAALKKIFTESVYGSGAEDGTYGDYDAFIESAIKLLAEKAGISWGTSAHTAVDVPVYAIGAGAEKFSGYIDNTEIPKLIGQVMQLSE